MTLNTIANFEKTADARCYIAAIESRVKAVRHFIPDHPAVAATAARAPAPMIPSLFPVRLLRY
jgi:hypothetical protein